MDTSRQGIPADHNRLTALFTRKKHRVLNVYCTAGFPQLDSTLEVMQSLETNGADIIELGMPYSDPLADGPVIQQSGHIALQNGMTINVLFRQLQGMRKKVHIPVVLMGYMNPVLQYGIEKFCADAATVGVDGIILPDLPVYEFETMYRSIFEKHGLKFIFLVTPETATERIKKLDALSSGFLYAVSSSSTTGNNKPIGLQEDYFKRLEAMELANPVLVGFGIKDKATFNAAARYSAGAIIGSAYINVLSEGDNIGQSTKEFLNSILGKVG